MAVSRASTVNMTVDDRKSTLSYDIKVTDLMDCKKSDFTFSIRPGAESGQEKGVFQVTKNGCLVRQKESEPFPVGAISKKSIDTTVGKSSIVKVKKHMPIDLGDYFN